jgi:alpha-tubulin suppressor-like RCC1 family protein
MHTKHTLALAADGSVYAFGEGSGLGISYEGAGEEAVERRSHHRIFPSFSAW